MRASPAWLTALLTFATGGLYLIVWAGLSWSIRPLAAARLRDDDAADGYWPIAPIQA